MVVGVALVFVLLIACDPAEPRTGAESDESSTARTVYDTGDVLYTCGHVPFDPNTLEGPGDLEHSESALGAALRDLLASPEGNIGDGGWRVVARTKRSVQVAAPAPEGDIPYVNAFFRRSDGRWEASGWGDCLPMAVVGERNPALWELEIEPGSGATQLHLLVKERDCTSGRELTEDNTRAEVEYAEDAIVILMSADPLKKGNYNCIGNVPAPITVELEEPVGDRRLVDAGSYPPTRRDA
jgi:hypothetical protein